MDRGLYWMWVMVLLVRLNRIACPEPWGQICIRLRGRLRAKHRSDAKLCSIEASYTKSKILAVNPYPPNKKRRLTIYLKPSARFLIT